MNDGFETIREIDPLIDQDIRGYASRFQIRRSDQREVEGTRPPFELEQGNRRCRSALRLARNLHLKSIPTRIERAIRTVANHTSLVWPAAYRSISPNSGFPDLKFGNPVLPPFD